MAPKKKQPKSGTKPKNHAAEAKPAPKLQISAENERRLRRLLLNTDRPAPASGPGHGNDSASRAQKSKRLRSLYDNLSLEGFTADQIEKALSALRDGATFESALDWLCLNIPGNELPLKFSSGAFSSAPEERSVKIISTARVDYVPPQRPLNEVKEKMDGVSIKTKGQHDELSLDLGKSSQADWIRQYMEQQEAEEQEEEDDPSSRAASIAEEYHSARLGALQAKQEGDKKRKDHFSDIINRLKQEMSSLGLSDDMLVSRLEDQCTISSLDETPFESTNDTFLKSIPADGAGSEVDFAPLEIKPVAAILEEASGLMENENAVDVIDNLVTEVEKNLEPEDLEIDNLFSEDSSSLDQLPPEILRQQRKEKLPRPAYGHSFANVDEIWKKGDPRSIPKSVLQKLCQRLGWEAPKYSKLSEKENRFLYSVNILRTATGRGKSRKAGGLITLQLPDQDEAIESVEDAQNKVAAFALYQLFPDLPLCQMLKEPYASFIDKMQEDELSTTMEVTEDIRRASFVDSLLHMDTSHPVVSLDVTSDSFGERVVEQQADEVSCDSNSKKIKMRALADKESHYREQTESNFLKKELENKMKLPKYKEMMEARAALPIAKLQNYILQILNENDVIVVCGETGCGKTTQVPQFILDDMIWSGLGGRCNIVCTQPRRIAAISVAERVSNERCESSPGSDGSLVGYQVRLDSARNEKTKLLFCTTGILLRKLGGNRDLAGITHVIVDEVHERSLLGDFLLIVLKNLVKRRAKQEGQNLKVILMSATVDSSLFSRYFGNCPVISAEGRTYPVSTYFLEDVYENLNYCLPSDSPASGTFMAPRRGKPGSNSVDNHRGKRNLVLSGWGDESVLLERYSNPFYFPDAYESYSERTRQNLRSLNEEIIDFDLLEDLVCYIDENYPPGAILVFLPGVAEIDMLVDKLTASFQFGGVSSDWVLPLHSSLASGDQRKVFMTPPENIRKVIVSTDIAETSITIDDVTYVVDSGKHKENRFNPQKKMSSMVEDWIAQANAKQRRGRAGRVKPGICFSLYTRHRFENIMHTFQVPEMLRMPLTELCLQIKSLSLGDIKSILLEAIEPPREEAISSAVDLLYKVGAFEGNEELSPLGYHLAKLPVDVLIGKMMLYGAIFGCLSPVLSIAAFLSYKAPFAYPKDEKQNVERAKSTLLGDNLDATVVSNEGNRQSDHLLLVVAYNKWEKNLRENGVKAAQQFCRSFFLSSSVMYTIRDMRTQFGNLLADIGIVNLPAYSIQGNVKRKDQLDSWFANMSQPFNMYAHHASVIKSILCAGLYPNVAATIEGIDEALSSNKVLHSSIPIKDRPLWYDGRREVHIHPSSVNHNVKVFRYPFLVYLEKVETSKVFLRDTSIISPYSILLFGGAIVIHHQTGSVIIDNWLKLKAPAQTAVLFKELRSTLHAVLKELICNPERATMANNEVVKSIIHLLLEEDKAQYF